MVTLFVSMFNGCPEGYILMFCIGAISFPVFAGLVYCLAVLCCKIQDYLYYLKKRKQVFDRLYPQYKALMKGKKDE